MQSKSIIQVPILAFCLVFIMVGCGGDGPTKPIVKKPADYIVYARDSGKDSVVYRFHSLSYVVDSIRLPVVSQELVYPSADGKRLFINKGTHALVYDAQTLEPITDLPYPTGGFVASPDGKLIVLSGSHRVTVLRTSDYSLEFADTGVSRITALSPKNDTIYGYLTGGGYSVIYRANIWDSTVLRDTIVGQVVRFLPALGGQRWCFMRPLDFCFTPFEVYDPKGDSDVFVAIHGEDAMMRSSPDGRYIYYEFPQAWDCPGRLPALRVYDAEENRIVADIHTRCVNDSLPDCGNDGRFLFRNFVVSPDGRWIVGTNGWQYISIIDVAKQDVTWNIAVPGALDVNGLTVQAGP